MSSAPATRAKNKKTDSESSKKESDKDFTDSLVTALTDARVINALQAAFSGIVEKMTEEITSLKQCIDERDKQIQSLSEQVDELKQQEKRNVVRIDGLSEHHGHGLWQNEESAAETVSKFVSETLEIPLMKWEIESAFRVGKKDQSRPRRLIVRFLSHDKKKAIMMAKKKLRQTQGNIPVRNQVFLNDDLTELRGKIFQTARQAVKDKRLFSTWIFDGKVFVKVKQSDDPVQVKTLSGVNAVLSSL